MGYPKKGLSIDIGHDQIKIIEYKRSRDKAKIKKAFCIDTPDNCVDDGMITHMEALVEVIGKALEAQAIKEKNVIFTVASSKIITREVDLPDLPKKKLDALIQMNAEEYFPVDLTDYTTDYRILDHYVEGEDKMIRVNMIAAYTELMESYINLAGMLSLKVVGADFTGNSIVNFSEHMKKEGVYLLLDLGSNSTMVTIMNGKTVRFNRNLIYGTSIIVNSIQNYFNVRYAEAVKISGEQALLGEEVAENDPLASEVMGSLNQILSGVARLVDFYTSRNKDNIEKIYVVGGGTKINGILAYITSYFSIEATTVGPLETITYQAEAVTAEDVFFSNAVGALFSDINLLPKAYLNKDKEKANMRVRLEIGLLLLVLTGAALYIPYSTNLRLKAEKQVLQEEINEKQVVEEVKARHDAIMAKANFYTALDDLSGSTTEVVVAVLEVMEKEIPSAIEYLSISNTEESMIISCVAKDKLTIIKYIEALKAMEIDGVPIFSEVFVPGFAQGDGVGEDGGQYSFSITCTYNMEVGQ